MVNSVLRSATVCGFVLLLSLVLAGCSGDDKKADKAAPQEATPMKVVKAETRDVPNWGEWVGQISAHETVEVRARVAGFLIKKNFEEGGTVKEGDLLFVIDPKPFEEDLKQAQSGLEYNQALYNKAAKDLKRFKKLFDEGVVSRDEYESYQTQAATYKAQLADNSAKVQNAKIQLGYTKIYSPIDGVIGRVQVDVGNLVGQGENTLLATISTMDPIYVSFNVSEGDYIRAMRDKQARESGERPIRLVLADGSEYSQPGRFDMVDPTVDPQTGTLGIRVLFPNPEDLLKPRPVRQGPGACLQPPERGGHPGHVDHGRPGHEVRVPGGRGRDHQEPAGQARHRVHDPGRGHRGRQGRRHAPVRRHQPGQARHEDQAGGGAHGPGLRAARRRKR